MDPTPHPTSHGAFTADATGTPDLSRRQAAGRNFVRPSRGVRYPVDALDPRRAEWEATLLGTRPGTVLSGATAAEHWQLPMPPWIALGPRRPTTVAVPAGGAHPDRQHVRGQRLLLPTEHVTTHLGLAVTTPARTWLDCAADMPVEHLIAMGDAVLRGRLATKKDLGDVVHWGYRRRGVLAARQALPFLDDRSESPGESLARAHLVLNGVPRPVCNLDVHDHGRWLARVDMAWPDCRLIVEYDGAVHLQEQQRRRDAQRRNLLQEAGWMVITFTADDLRRPWLMATQVKRALAARSPR